MCAAKVDVAPEMRASLQHRPVMVCKALKHSAGGCVGGGDGGDQTCGAAHPGKQEKLIKQTLAKALAARGFVNSDLPDEHAAGLLRRAVSRNPTGNAAGMFSQNAGAGEMCTLQ